MEETNKIKITYAKNLDTLNFNILVSSAIDNNVNIKRVIDTSSYIYDTKVDCGNGKAIISGKLGLKVLYIDVDDITNSITLTSNFSESLISDSITNNSYINVFEHSISNNILSIEDTLKVNCEVSINPIIYLNIPINNSINLDNLVVKKSEIETNSISQFINSNFDYSLTFETKDKISKILNHNCYYCNTNITCCDNYIVLEGKLYSNLVYETVENEETVIKQLNDCFNIKNDVQIADVSVDDILDVSFKVDKSREVITVETEEDNNEIVVKNNIMVCGIVSKNIKLEIIDDAYSVENEIEVSLKPRDYTKELKHANLTENIFNEISLTNNEPAIDSLVANLNIVPEITNSYIKDGNLYFEGIICSNLVYIDENKMCNNKIIEVPFIINSKVMADNINCLHKDINIVDCKIKVKRGTIIEIDYLLNINICLYSTEQREIINNIVIGKSLDFSNYDYQIYIAKPNETLWQLCKRIKTTPEQLTSYNKELPLELNGGEKIIIKR